MWINTMIYVMQKKIICIDYLQMNAQGTEIGEEIGDQEWVRTFSLYIFFGYLLKEISYTMCIHYIFKNVSNWEAKIDERSSMLRESF